jgi:chemotaxis protein histidine kinase CheA
MKLIITLGCCIALAAVTRAEQDPNKKKKTAEQQLQQHQEHQQQKLQQHQEHQQLQQQQHQQHQQLHQEHQAEKNQLHQEHQQLHQEHQAEKHQEHQEHQQLHQEHQAEKHQMHQEQHQLHQQQKFQVQHFNNVAKGPKPGIASAKFHAGFSIPNSHKWQGPKYVVFQNYHSQWHDQGWWHSHHNRIVCIGGGWYFWDAGYWYPAWGYDAGQAYYPYDGPIYAYNDLPPDQVVANVQAALQASGYYQGEVDGLLGPLTRAALADYQRDQGLYTTAAIDEPTLESLGLS